MNIVSIIGLTAAFFTTVAFVPQSIKTLRSRDTEGISLLMYLLFVTGICAWIVYGALIGDLAILTGNIVTFLFATPVLIVTVVNYVRNKS